MIRSLEFVRRGRAIAPGDISSLYFQAMVDCMAGKKNDALEALPEALCKAYHKEEAQSDPELKDLQGLPQFAARMREFGGKWIRRTLPTL